MFFDEYPRFRDTSGTDPGGDRLNLRYEAVVAANRDIFDGARVVDIASHDGRWSFAALQTGASHVTGIEARQEFVDDARTTFAQYGVEPESYRFLCGDVFDTLSRESLDADVVLCLGYLYHTYRHTELLYRIRELDPKYVIIDSRVMTKARQPLVRVRTDEPEKHGHATLDPYSHDGKTLVALPSVSAITLMLRAYDFEVEQAYDWTALLAAHPSAGKLDDYASGARVTLRCRSGASAEGPEEPAAQSPEEPAARPSEEPAGRARETAPTDAGTPGGGQKRLAGTSPSRGSGWRNVVNRTLARVTGYELTRAAPPSRG